MKRIFLIILILLSCKALERNVGELKQEKGVVVAKQYKPSIDASGSGLGITTNGNLTITSVSIHEAQKFDVVFKCEHGIIFTINRAEVYAKVEENDNVIINFKEITNGYGELVDFDFIDANSIRK